MAAQNMGTCLVIRAPNQKFGDQQVYCPIDWSVQQLKQHLSKVYPTNPRPEDQKLIYSGQLLEDETTLKDVFQMDFGKMHILHLVCRPTGDSPEASSSAVPLVAISQPDISMTGGSVSTVPSTSSVNSASSDGLRHRSTSPGAVPNGQMPFALGMPPGASSPEQLVQQVALAQQLYAHYFTQYMHLMHQAAAPVATQASAQRPPSPEADTPAAPAAPPAAPRAAPDNRGPRMNAQGGPLLDEEEEEAAQRDWLDWVYTVSRATVLLSIVYFYSSFGRFLVVTGIALLMYLYQGGWFAAPWQQQHPEREHDRNRAREANNHQRQAGHPAGEPQEMPQGEAGPQQREEAVDQDDIGIVAPPTPPPPPEPPMSPMTTAWTFVATFFTSLIPEQPPPVNAN